MSQQPPAPPAHKFSIWGLVSELIDLAAILPNAMPLFAEVMAVIAKHKAAAGIPTH